MPEVDVDTLVLLYPERIGYRQAAEIISRHFYPISHRTLERWPLVHRTVNGKVVLATREVLSEAERRFRAAPAIMVGRRR